MCEEKVGVGGPSSGWTESAGHACWLERWASTADSGTLARQDSTGHLPTCTSQWKQCVESRGELHGPCGGTLPRAAAGQTRPAGPGNRGAGSCRVRAVLRPASLLPGVGWGRRWSCRAGRGGCWPGSRSRSSGRYLYCRSLLYCTAEIVTALPDPGRGAGLVAHLHPPLHSIHGTALSLTGHSNIRRALSTSLSAASNSSLLWSATFSSNCSVSTSICCCCCCLPCAGAGGAAPSSRVRPSCSWYGGLVWVYTRLCVCVPVKRLAADLRRRGLRGVF